MQHVLGSGYLRVKNGDGSKKKKKYTITTLEEKHLSTLMDLQEVIVRHLGNPDLLQPFSSDFMKRHLGTKGVILGVFVEKQLAAFRNIYYPAPSDKDWNFSIDMGLANEELPHVANLQMVCVHPIFRGNGLAKKMNRIALEFIRKKGSHYHVCAVVSPLNIWNIPVLLASGFHIAELMEKFNGKIRYIVYQDLRKPQTFDDSTSVHVPLEDLETQRKLLKSGHLGTSIIQRKDIPLKDPVKNYMLEFKYPA